MRSCESPKRTCRDLTGTRKLLPHNPGKQGFGRGAGRLLPASPQAVKWGRLPLRTGTLLQSNKDFVQQDLQDFGMFSGKAEAAPLGLKRYSFTNLSLPSTCPLPTCLSSSFNQLGSEGQNYLRQLPPPPQGATNHAFPPKNHGDCS